MLVTSDSIVDMKVITIGMVSEMTGLSQRKIRYYEERNLIFPGRSLQGYRIYSFQDVETLMGIADQIEDGVQTFEIRKEIIKKERKIVQEEKDKMRIGQLNSHFRLF
ncbi:MAG: MerR family transcriptional regulator [Bacillus sp. (in: firmicutes)]